MPPKKGAQAQGSKKTQEKKKDKVIEVPLLCIDVRLVAYYSYSIAPQDKTFGLKNKKGKKQQQFIQQVTSQVKYGQQSLQKVRVARMGEPTLI